MLPTKLTFAGEDRIEFLRFGKPLLAQQPPMPSETLQRYQEAISRENGPTTCSFRKSDGTIDMEKGLDWGKVDELIDLEVCLFFVAAEIRNAYLLRDFMTASGFRTSPPAQVEANVARWMGIHGEGLDLSGNISIAQLPRGFEGFLGTLWAYGLSVGVSLDEAGRPYNTQATLNRN